MTLKTVATLIQRALLDPHSPEAANALASAAIKLNRAGFDLHALPLFAELRAPATVTVETYNSVREYRAEIARLKQQLETMKMQANLAPFIAAAKYHEAEAQRIRHAVAMLEMVTPVEPTVAPTTDTSNSAETTPKPTVKRAKPVNSKVTPEMRATILGELAKGVTAAALAKRFDVSPATVSGIKKAGQ